MSGIKPVEFWNYSVAEISDMLESYRKNEEQRIKREVIHDFVMAEVQTRYTFREKQDAIPRPWDYYPELFAEEKKVFDVAEKEKAFEEYKEKRQRYVEEYNRRRQGV